MYYLNIYLNTGERLSYYLNDYPELLRILKAVRENGVMIESNIVKNNQHDMRYGVLLLRTEDVSCIDCFEV